MRKFIRSTDDISGLFDINLYTDMDRLSAFEWFFLLQSRYLIFLDVLENGLSAYILDDLNEEEEQEVIGLLIKKHLKNPLSVDLKVTFKKKNGESLEIEISNSDYHYFMENYLPVAELYISDLNKISNFVEQIGQHTFSIDHDKSSNSIGYILNSIKDFGLGCYEYPIKINPYYPDSVIIKEIENLLAKVRKKFGFDSINKVLSRKDLLNWASYKLLAYFDLKILEKYEGVKITNSVICSILYPKGEYGEDNLRKSVYPIMSNILSQVGFGGLGEKMSIFDGLRYLAYIEFQENGKKID